MKILALCIVLAVCIALTYANGRGMYMGKYGMYDGRRCAKDCSYLPPGNHPSCTACNMYVTCVIGNRQLYDRTCPHNLEWDNTRNICNWPAYSTCYNLNI